MNQEEEKDSHLSSENQELEKHSHSSFEKKQDLEKHDPLTNFMFGKRDRYEQKEDDYYSSPNYGDWLFGPRQNKHLENQKNSNNEYDFNNLYNFLNKIDFEEVFNNLDKLMETAGQFKPLWKQISPLIQKLKK